MEDSSSNEFRDESELVRELIAGNETAFRIVAREITRRFLPLATKKTRNEEDAKDVLNAAACKVITRIETFRVGRGRSFWSWAAKIVANQAVDHLRERARQRPAEVISLEDFGGDIEALRDVAPAVLEGDEVASGPSSEMQALKEGLERLLERDREILELHFLLGMSDAEVAAEVGIPNIDNVRKYRSRALKRLREILEAHPAFRKWNGNGRLRLKSAPKTGVRQVRRAGA